MKDGAIALLLSILVGLVGGAWALSLRHGHPEPPTVYPGPLASVQVLPPATSSPAPGLLPAATAGPRIHYLEGPA